MSHHELHRSTTAVTTVPEKRIFLVDRKAAAKAPEAADATENPAA